MSDQPIMILTSEGPKSLEEVAGLLAPFQEAANAAYARFKIESEEREARELLLRNRKALLQSLFPDYPVGSHRGVVTEWFNAGELNGYGEYLRRAGIDPIHLLIFEQHEFRGLDGLRTERFWGRVLKFREAYATQVAQLEALSVDPEVLRKRNQTR